VASLLTRKSAALADAGSSGAIAQLARSTARKRRTDISKDANPPASYDDATALARLSPASTHGKQTLTDFPKRQCARRLKCGENWTPPELISPPGEAGDPGEGVRFDGKAAGRPALSAGAHTAAGQLPRFARREAESAAEGADESVVAAEMMVDGEVDHAHLPARRRDEPHEDTVEAALLDVAREPAFWLE
jgi:hypothetical protein